MSEEFPLVSSVGELVNINLSTLKSQEIGLSLLLLNIATREAKRINKLASIIDKLEDYIFDPEIMEHLTPTEQIQRYSLALQSTQQSSAYISGAIKSISWSDIETKIMILSQEDNNSSKVEGSGANLDIQTAAMRLLSKISSDLK